MRIGFELKLGVLHEFRVRRAFTYLTFTKQLGNHQHRLGSGDSLRNAKSRRVLGRIVELGTHFIELVLQRATF
jgi:hypothetical protein